MTIGSQGSRPTKNQRREEARETAREHRLVAQKNERRRRFLVQGGVVAGKLLQDIVTVNIIIVKSNRTRVGLNSLANRLYTINGIVPLEWLNLSIDSYKIRCKKLLL